MSLSQGQGKARHGTQRSSTRGLEGLGRWGEGDGRRGGQGGGRRIQAAPRGLGPHHTEEPSPPPGPQALRDSSKPEPILFEANPESKLHYSETLQIQILN